MYIYKLLLLLFAFYGGIMNILIADDEKIITDLVADSLVGLSDNIITTNDYSKVMKLTKGEQFDIILLDMFFPNQQGIELMNEIKKTKSTSPVLFLSSNFNPILIKKAFDSGASGYISKSAGKEELISAVKSVVKGEKYICKKTSELILKDAMNDEIEELSLAEKLTEREVEILKLIADGLTANEIAETLFISPKTVENHKANMMEKFETNKIVKLVKVAFENNII